MPINWNAFDREEEDISQRLADGLITSEQARKEQQELQRDARGAYEQECEDAVQRVRDDNGGW